MGTKVNSMILRIIKKLSHLSSSLGTRSPIRGGKNRERHHGCVATSMIKESVDYHVVFLLRITVVVNTYVSHTE